MKCVFIVSNIIPARTKEQGRAVVIFPTADSYVMEWRFESAKKGEKLIL